MNYYLLSAAFVIFSSYLSKLSYSNDITYEIHVDSLYSTAASSSTNITCESKQGDDCKLIKAKRLSKRIKFVQWNIKAGEYSHDTVQTCTLRNQPGEEDIDITAFDGSWSLDEIIWETYTHRDFIFDSDDGKYIYYWGLSEEGVKLRNAKTTKYELVVPKHNNNLRDQVFVSNLFKDERKISLICVPNEESSDDAWLANEKSLRHKIAVGWPIMGSDHVAGKVHTCLVGWKSKAKGRTEYFYFTAFEGSWRLDEILLAPYTRNDFILNPYSRKSNYLWSVSEKGLSLYNFRAKDYQVVIAFAN